MKNRIYLKQLGSYQYASESAKKRMGNNPCFDLGLLPTEIMREEMKSYIMARSQGISSEKLYSEKRFFNHVCRLIQEKGKGLNSFSDWEKERWLRQMKGWLLAQGLPLTHKEKGIYGEYIISRAPTLRYLERLLDFLAETDGCEETEKDIWKLEKLNIDYNDNLVRHCKTINFTKIIQPDIRRELKKAILFQLKAEAIHSVLKEMTAMRRLSKYLSEKQPQIGSCADITREVFEEYLIYLKTEDTGKKDFRAELTRLRSILGTIGDICRYPQLRTIILNRDIPPTRKAEFKVYSDNELKRLNAFLVKTDE